jgi:tetratricopeptide (TPR) repeat protein
MEIEPTMRFWLLMSMLAASFACASDTYAQSLDQQARWCGGLDGASDDLAINACTALIQSGKVSTRNLAEAFISRGTAYGHKGQNDRALQEYDQAIRVAPGFAEAFFNRGYTHYLKGQNDRAIQDYDQAIRLKPDFALAFKYRGDAKLKKGDVGGGNADIAKAKQINPKIK